MTRILVVVAHPDDEVLACGGTLAKWAAAGASVQVLIAADGERGRPGSSAEAVERRWASAQKAGKILGTLPPISLGLVDQRLEERPVIEIARAIEAIVSEFQPDRVLSHSHADLNRDHRIVAEATAVAFRPNGGVRCEAYLQCEVPSSTEIGAMQFRAPFNPQMFVDISAVMPMKEAALACYKEEMREAPHVRSTEAISALARWRGACVGMAFAEAFEIAFLKG